MTIRCAVLLAAGISLIAALPVLAANETLDRAQQMEDAGNSSGARSLLAQAARNSSDAELLTGHAER